MFLLIFSENSKASESVRKFDVKPLNKIWENFIIQVITRSFEMDSI